jgi:hypothetical protein
MGSTPADRQASGSAAPSGWRERLLVPVATVAAHVLLVVVGRVVARAERRHGARPGAAGLNGRSQGGRS